MKTPEETTHQIHAQALLADIRGASVAAFPRRDAITEWLDAYLDRTGRKDYVTDATEAKDLIALDQFLRTYHVPVAGGSAA